MARKRSYESDSFNKSHSLFALSDEIQIKCREDIVAGVSLIATHCIKVSSVALKVARFSNDRPLSEQYYLQTREYHKEATYFPHKPSHIRTGKRDDADLSIQYLKTTPEFNRVIDRFTSLLTLKQGEL